MGRREVTTAVTMLALLGVLVVAALWGWRWLSADLPGETSATPAAEATPTCTTREPGQRVRSTQVRVSVFNSGTRSGLAGETLEALQERGFRAGDVANAPAGVRVRRVQVWSTSEADAGARLVARQFGKRVRVRVSEQDLGPGVDVVVGNGLRGLSKAPRSTRVRQPQEICAPASEGAEDTAS